MQVAKRVGRYFQEARVANARAVITFAMILASAAFAAGCAGGAPKQANPDAVGSDGAPTTSERTAEETAAPELGDGEEARAGDALVVRVGVDGVTVRAGDSEVRVGAATWLEKAARERTK